MTELPDTPPLCACGCGEEATIDRRRKRVSKYKSGHNSRANHPMQGKTHTDEARQKIRSARASQVSVVGGGPAVRPAIDRFLDHVEKTDKCWLWTGSTNGNGDYGAFGVGSERDGTARVIRAHRFSYEHFIGPIPVGLELDHTCTTPICVNPEHLEPVTHAENLRRGAARRRAFRDAERARERTN